MDLTFALERKMKKVAINTEYLTLGQFLKVGGIIQTGGEAKSFLRETEVIVNSERDSRRGRKLYDGDIVEIRGEQYRIVHED